LRLESNSFPKVEALGFMYRPFGVIAASVRHAISWNFLIDGKPTVSNIQTRDWRHNLLSTVLEH